MSDKCWVYTGSSQVLVLSVIHGVPCLWYTEYRHSSRDAEFCTTNQMTTELWGGFAVTQRHDAQARKKECGVVFQCGSEIYLQGISVKTLHQELRGTRLRLEVVRSVDGLSFGEGKQTYPKLTVIAYCQIGTISTLSVRLYLTILSKCLSTVEDVKDRFDRI